MLVKLLASIFKRPTQPPELPPVTFRLGQNYVFELFGHRRVVGQAREMRIGRVVEMIEITDTDGMVHYYSPKAIYGYHAETAAEADSRTRRWDGRGYDSEMVEFEDDTDDDTDAF